MQSKLGIMYKTYNNLGRKAFINAENAIYVITKYIFILDSYWCVYHTCIKHKNNFTTRINIYIFD